MRGRGSTVAKFVGTGFAGWSASGKENGFDVELAQFFAFTPKEDVRLTREFRD
jgi:hypothetical protein